MSVQLNNLSSPECNSEDDDYLDLKMTTTQRRDSDDDNERSVLITSRMYVPRDKLKLVYIIFYLLGIASLLPWNFFITANQYFSYKFRNVTINDTRTYNEAQYRTELQNTFETYFSISAMIPNILFNLFNTLATKWIPIKLRLVVSFVIMLIMFAITVVLVKLNTDPWQMTFFITTIITVVVINASSAILAGASTGLACIFPSKYVQVLMMGQGMGGTFAAVASIISIWLGTSVLSSALGYFLSATFVLVLALIAYLFLKRMEFARHYIDLHEKVLDSVDKLSGSFKETKQSPSLLIVFKEIWILGFSVLFTFCVTLSVYPSVATLNVSFSHDDGSIFTNDLFIPLTCFLMFNVGDLLGRTAAGFLQLPAPLLPILSFLRVGFIPLIMMCNIQPRHHLPVVFDSDVYFVVFITLLAFTNGYLGTLCMMYAPQKVPKEHVETTGAMMSFFLVTGLASGSLLGLLLVKIV